MALLNYLIIARKKNHQIRRGAILEFKSLQLKIWLKQDKWEQLQEESYPAILVADGTEPQKSF